MKIEILIELSYRPRASIALVFNSLGLVTPPQNSKEAFRAVICCCDTPQAIEHKRNFHDITMCLDTTCRRSTEKKLQRKS